MKKPMGFTWVEKPWLGAMPRPRSVDELRWLKNQGIDVLVSLTERRLDPEDVDEAGLLAYHVPVADMTPPSPSDLNRCISAINRARDSKMGVVVHCGAGMGRTGVVLACWFITQGMSAEEAIKHVRELRPGSIETRKQLDAIRNYPAPQMH
jgi:atypical dual specificity phosphatase